MMLWPNMMGGFFGGEFIWMIFFFIFGVAVIVGVIFLIVWLVRKTSGSQPDSITDNKNSLEILKQRYARGDITKKEFENIKKDIT